MSDQRMGPLHDVIGTRPKDDAKMLAIVETISTLMQPSDPSVATGAILRQMMMAIVGDMKPDTIAHAASAHIRVTMHVIERLAEATGTTPQKAWEAVAADLREELRR